MLERLVKDITDFIFMEDKAPESADLICIPGSSYPNLPEYAAKLYHKNLAPYLVPSGGVSVKTGVFNGVKAKKHIYNLDYKTECDFYCHVLTHEGVPESAIIREEQSGYTKANALLSKEAVEKAGIAHSRIIVCCKGFHARRCFMLYQLAFPKSEIFILPTSDGYPICKENWFKTPLGINQVLGELSRCGNQTLPELETILTENLTNPES